MINPCFSACYPVWLGWGLWHQRQTRGPRSGTFAQVICVVIGFTVICVRLPETKGKSLEQIERELTS